MRYLLFVLAGLVASQALALDPKKCFSVTHGNGLLMKYEFPGYSSSEYMQKKHGFVLGTFVHSTQGMVASLDPSVTTGRFLSTSQLTTTSNGGCSYYSLMREKREIYLADHYDAVMQHIAQGNGGHLKALFQLHSCEPQAFAAFRDALRNGFAGLRLSDGSQALGKGIDAVLRQNSISASCGPLS